ncbi:hypothetical protein FX016_19920 [Cupriavidus gilardii]|uniref:ParB-like protein n=1 Tax=Cupriavidus sp. DB3 TaxID=2873259 RepID=UPI0011EE741A|nr:ParB/Srx family N-terminal domain-containing protein [Cupriavidus sp. DB3]KAA0179335.1 hypothetical protein FX016_19920 [Cupriavidus gilardii]MCA7086475.1 ParB/Srx family N-terminal domain-containing protein [Cupriavidus sp. DB3]
MKRIGETARLRDTLESADDRTAASGAVPVPPAEALTGEVWRKGARVTLPVRQLRPTQMTVGLYHVQSKMDVTLRHQGRKQIELMERHRIHVVIGPGPAFYVIDHHHWARAWYELGIESVPVVIKHNWSALPPDRFWLEMEARHLVHPYDQYGERQGLAALPHSLAEMRDDPYRSLEAFAQLAGGYDKVKQAYPDFRWADFFRRHIDGRLDTVPGFALALAHAVKLARSSKARGLPGHLDDREDGKTRGKAGGKAGGKAKLGSIGKDKGTKSSKSGGSGKSGKSDGKA